MSTGEQFLRSAGQLHHGGGGLCGQLVHALQVLFEGVFAIEDLPADLTGVAHVAVHRHYVSIGTAPARELLATQRTAVVLAHVRTHLGCRKIQLYGRRRSKSPVGRRGPCRHIITTGR